MRLSQSPVKGARDSSPNRAPASSSTSALLGKTNLFTNSDIFDDCFIDLIFLYIAAAVQERRGTVYLQASGHVGGIPHVLNRLVGVAQDPSSTDTSVLTAMATLVTMLRNTRSVSTLAEELLQALKLWSRLYATGTTVEKARAAAAMFVGNIVHFIVFTCRFRVNTELVACIACLLKHFVECFRTFCTCLIIYTFCSQ